MRKFVVLVLFYFMSCNADELNNDTQASSTDTLRHNTTRIAVTKENMQDYKPLNNKNELIGVWASNNKEPITIEINADSIYYTEHFESHKYTVIEDSIFIGYPDFIFSAKVYFDNDTLVMESEDGKSKFYRFKE